ncbi:MAG: hypothetical protein SF123_14355 [Chloroflexota bacterium]|nr:hypothetical protein [Chloroflexota bacterium]
MKHVRLLVVLVALLLVLTSVSSAFAFPTRDSDPGCLVMGDSQNTPVFSAPSLMAPIINNLNPGENFRAEGYVIVGGQKFFLILKHDPGNEWTIGDGYVHEWDVTETYSTCGNLRTPGFTIDLPR